jgi:hypothetical protein
MAKEDFRSRRMNDFMDGIEKHVKELSPIEIVSIKVGAWALINNIVNDCAELYEQNKKDK